MEQLNVSRHCDVLLPFNTIFNSLQNVIHGGLPPLLRVITNDLFLLEALHFVTNINLLIGLRLGDPNGPITAEPHHLTVIRIPGRRRMSHNGLAPPGVHPPRLLGQTDE